MRVACLAMRCLKVATFHKNPLYSLITRFWGIFGENPYIIKRNNEDAFTQFLIILKCLLCCFLLLWFVLYSLCDRFDGDSVENNPEAAMDKSKPWSRSIEDLHGGNTLQSPITGNGITRTGRHSTLRYGGHTGSWLRQKDSIRLVCLCGLWLLTADFAPCAPLFLSVKPEHCGCTAIYFLAVAQFIQFVSWCSRLMRSCGL